MPVPAAGQILSMAALSAHGPDPRQALTLRKGVGINDLLVCR